MFAAPPPAPIHSTVQAPLNPRFHPRTLRVPLNPHRPPHGPAPPLPTRPARPRPRLDAAKASFGELSTLTQLGEVLGKGVWRNLMVVLTHANAAREQMGAEYAQVRACVCVRVCVYVCLWAVCVCAHAHVNASARACVCELYSRYALCRRSRPPVPTTPHAPALRRHPNP
jgi:hypothetical protein